jgi:tetrahydromethanopterin S-methyltransferase subunit G
MARLSVGKLVGMIFGCVVVGIMLFMMFAVLAGLFAGEQ